MKEIRESFFNIQKYYIYWNGIWQGNGAHLSFHNFQTNIAKAIVSNLEWFLILKKKI